MSASRSNFPGTPRAPLSPDARTGLFREFSRRGILLKQDLHLPDVVGHLAGGPIRGTWWSHPGAHALFDALLEFAESPDVLLVKLVAGKDTFVHRRLWPAVLGAALEGAAWQKEGLTPAAGALLAVLEKTGEAKASGAAAREIQLRLLAHVKPARAGSGRRAAALELESWSGWQARMKAEALPADEARAQLESALAEIGGGPELLPWRKRKRPVRKAG